MSYVLSLQDHVLFLTLSIGFFVSRSEKKTNRPYSRRMVQKLPTKPKVFQSFLAKVDLLYTAASYNNVSFIIFSKTLPSPFSNTVSLQCGVVNKLIKNCRKRIPLRIEENAIWKT